MEKKSKDYLNFNLHLSELAEPETEEEKKAYKKRIMIDNNVGRLLEPERFVNHEEEISEENMSEKRIIKVIEEYKAKARTV